MLGRFLDEAILSLVKEYTQRYNKKKNNNKQSYPCRMAGMETFPISLPTQ